MKEKWQISELQEFLSKHAEDEHLDAQTVYLSNPKYRQKIDHIIVNNLWKGVQEGVRESVITAELPEDYGMYQSIQEKLGVYTARTLEFMLSDPERPITRNGTVRWYCRGDIECSVTRYMISFDFYIYFPLTFAMKKILFLMSSPEFMCMRPELSYQESIKSEAILSLKFSKGEGASGGLLNYGAQAEERIFYEVQKNLNVIYALNALEIDFSRDESFDRLYQALVIAYECK